MDLDITEIRPPIETPEKLLFSHQIAVVKTMFSPKISEVLTHLLNCQRVKKIVGYVSLVVSTLRNYRT